MLRYLGFINPPGYMLLARAAFSENFGLASVFLEWDEKEIQGKLSASTLEGIELRSTFVLVDVFWRPLLPSVCR
jgi:hypothetical protein